MDITAFHPVRQSHVRSHGGKGGINILRVKAAYAARSSSISGADLSSIKVVVKDMEQGLTANSATAGGKATSPRQTLPHPVRCNAWLGAVTGRWR